MSDTKLLSVAVPCYNSQDYMEHCIQTLLTGGQDVEILIVDDGSTDNTADIADRYERDYPGIVRAIHQENAGHGGAVTTGIRNATGIYFKVVDSDDWVDEEAFAAVLDRLRELEETGTPIDLMTTNYIYDKVEAGRQKEMWLRHALRKDTVLTWDQTRRLLRRENFLMHALIYRTELLRNSRLKLPEHTFYVDNLYCTVPLADVKTLYYMDVGLYHYYIGREGQSVQQDVMVRRIDQQILVNKLMLQQVDLEHVTPRRLQQAIFHYHDIITAVTTVTLLLGGTKEHLEKKKELWEYIQREHPWEYKRLRRTPLGIAAHLPGRAGRRFDLIVYRVANRIFSFN